MIKSAFHLHTMQIPPQEGVQTISPKKLLSCLYRQDIGLPIITNKNSISDVKKIREYADRLDMFVPYAVEARTTDKEGNIVEIIAIFNEMNEHIERVIRNASRYNYREFIEYVKSRDGRVVLPHPYLKRVGIAHLEGEDVVEKLCREDLVDGVEWNLQMDNVLMRNNNVNNVKAKNLADRINQKYGMKIPLLYGNDVYFGDMRMIMEVDSNKPKEALEKLFEGRFKLRYVKTTMPFPYYALERFYTILKCEPESIPDLIL